MSLAKITFTGIDPSNSRSELHALLSADPRIELGILYSENMEYRSGTRVRQRYPAFSWIDETAADIEGSFGLGRVALHVCGGAVKAMIRGVALQVKAGAFHRVQLNGTFDEEDAARFHGYLRDSAEAGHKFITQYDSNPHLHGIYHPAHQVLFDASGGRGVLRTEWPHALPRNLCGYAGGLSPDNLFKQMPRIAAVAGPGYWVDMEQSLRDAKDRFSIEKAHLALEAILVAERVAAGA
jgi:phosphoribosylanthranilate isomerase